MIYIVYVCVYIQTYIHNNKKHSDPHEFHRVTIRTLRKTEKLNLLIIITN